VLKHKIKTIGAKALEKNLFLFFLFFFFFYQPVKSTLTTLLPFLSLSLAMLLFLRSAASIKGLPLRSLLCSHRPFTERYDIQKG